MVFLNFSCEVVANNVVWATGKIDTWIINIEECKHKVDVTELFCFFVKKKKKKKKSCFGCFN